VALLALFFCLVAGEFVCVVERDILDQELVSSIRVFELI
jgi:hypothetical protein